MLKYWAVILLELKSMICLDNYSIQEKTVKATGKKYARYMLTNKEKQINLHAT